MARETLVVHNPTPSDITFRLDKGMTDEIAAKSKHKQKSLLRNFSYNAKVPSRQSVDLVALSELTIAEIKNSSEFRMMLPRLVVQHDSSLEVIETPEEAPVDPQELMEAVDPIEVQDIDPVLPEDEIEEPVEEDKIVVSVAIGDEIIGSTEVILEKEPEPVVEEPLEVEPEFDAVEPQDVITDKELNDELKAAQIAEEPKAPKPKKTAKKTTKRKTKKAAK